MSLIDNAKNKIDDCESMIREFIRCTYTIGGEIIFSIDTYSINKGRGSHPYIRDRFDLTLMCIKNWYECRNKDTNPLRYPLSLKDNVKFFSMFRDFEEYCRFFFLDDLLENGTVKLFCPYDGKHPIPKDVDSYMELIGNQREFVRKRNERIKTYLSSL